MHDWLSERADVLADTAGVDRSRLELSDTDVQTLLELAGVAAHDSGERTNAPLLCYLIGLARESGRSIDELADAVR